MKKMLFVTDAGGNRAGDSVEMEDQDALDAFVSGWAVADNAEIPPADTESVEPKKKTK